MVEAISSSNTVSIDELEARLAEGPWFGNNQPSKEDSDLFTGLINQGEVPNAESHPNTLAWYTLMSRFT